MQVLASFDDGVVEDLVLSDIVQQYKIPTIFYFPAKPELVNEPHGRTSLTPAQRQTIAQNHEIGSHTVTHPLLTRIEPKIASNEIFDSRELLQKEFGQEINAFCYPRGYANPDLQRMVKDAGYTHARGVTVGFLDKNENPFYEATTVHVGCDRKEYAGLSWFEYAMKMIEASNHESIFHIWAHGWEIGKDIHNFELLDKLCSALAGLND